MPESYASRIPFVHAKSCLYALDTLQKALAHLCRTASVPHDVLEARDDFEAAFPSLTHVRDSAHHVEDRVRGKARDKQIQLKPVVNEAVRAPDGGVLIVQSLINNRYGGTLADGTYGEVEVSTDSVAQAQQVVQRVLNAYTWRGPRDHLPR